MPVTSKQLDAMKEHKKMIQSEQQTQTTKQIFEEARNGQPQQIEKRTAVSGEYRASLMTAEKIAANLPLQNANHQPMQVSAPLQPQQRAHMTKQQKRQLKKMQKRNTTPRSKLSKEQLQELQAQEDYVRSEYNKLFKAENRERRMAAKKKLLEDEVIAQGLKQQLESGTFESARQFLLETAARLIERDDTVKERLGGTVDYKEMILPMRLLINDHMTQEGSQTGEDLMQLLNVHEARFRAMEPQCVLVRMVTQELYDILEDEIVSSKHLTDANNSIADEYDRELSTVMNEWKGLEAMVAQETGARAYIPEDSINVFNSESPYAYLRKRDVLNKHLSRVQQIMKEEHVEEGAAQEKALRERRETLQTQAAVRSRMGNVVRNTSVDEWKENGGASFHQTLPAREALDAVKNSHGFLYAHDLKNGLMEVRPTLPETIAIGDQEYSLRQDYNLLIKGLIASVMDQDGKLVKSGDQTAKQVAEELEDCVVNYNAQLLGSHLRNGLKNLMPKAKDEDIDAICQRVMRTYVATSDRTQGIPMGTLLNGEIMQSLREFVVMVGQVQNTPFNQHKQEIEKNIGSDPRNAERLQETLNAAEHFHLDVAVAIDNMIKIRNMPEDSKDVPLHNACSANGMMMERLGRVMNANLNHITYMVDNHAEAHPEIYVNFIIDHPELFDSKLQNDGLQDEINKMKEQLDRNETLNKEQIGTLKQLTNPYIKYEYHVAGNAGFMPDGRLLTVEGFAAETKQAMVSPFIQRTAVGVYRGNMSEGDANPVSKQMQHEGMTRYYNHDNPLPDHEEFILFKNKIAFKNGRLNGKES